MLQAMDHAELHLSGFFVATAEVTEEEHCQEGCEPKIHNGDRPSIGRNYQAGFAFAL